MLILTNGFLPCKWYSLNDINFYLIQTNMLQNYIGNETMYMSRGECEEGLSVYK